MGKHNELATLLSATPRAASFRKYLVASYADSTKASYAGDVMHFKRWGGCIPATATQIAKYVAAYAGKLAYATIQRRLAGIHREHLARGYRSPVRSELVRATMKGVGRVYSRRQRKMEPLLKEQLLAMMKYMRGVVGARDRALMTIGFMGGFRKSELVALNVDDVQWLKRGLVVAVRRSKTDQEGRGREVAIPKTGGVACACRALRTWLDRAGIGTEGAIFRPIDRHGNVRPTRLSAYAVGSIVKRYVERIGMDPSLYAGHSLRAGLVTSAARAGAAAWQIKKQTGHKSEEVLAGYIRDGDKFANNVAELIFRK